MSLINDALRKAQTEVDRGGPVNPVAGSLAGAHVRPQKQNPIFRLATLVLVLGVAVWAVSLFKGSPEPSQPVAEVAMATPTAALESAPEVAPVPVEEEPAPVESPAPAASETVNAVSAEETPANDAVATPSETPAPVVAEAAEPGPTEPTESEAPVSAPASETAAPVASEIAADTAPPVPPATETVEEAPMPTTDQALRDEIIFTLKQLEVTAVMGDGSKARIMSGGQIHRAGELINLDLKIRFQGKKGKTLYFTDAAGEIYKKAL